MLLPAFDLLEPATLKGVFQALSAEGRLARPLAGGTDLVPDMKREHDRRLRFPSLPPFRPGPFPDVLVSLNRVGALRGVRSETGGSLRIGALATMAELAGSRKLGKAFGALSDGAGSVGSPQVRNRATIGGNLCNARPCADTAPPAIALGAAVEIESARGKRSVPAEAFFAGPGKTVLSPGEILTGIRIPAPAPVSGSAYFKLGTRKAFEIAVVSVAASLSVEEGRVKAARIVLGSCGPTPLLATGAGALLEGREPSEAALREAAKAAAAEGKPIDDFRASGAYRREMTDVLAFRALKLACQRAGAEI